ncbi:MAG: sugar ABC transporter permease [Anaerolineales bacterium]|nr:sugar ABC transporter permease [Anaerolineales bacterium]
MATTSLRKQDAKIGLLLVIPSLLIILGITLQPVLSTLYLSFFETPLSRPTGGVFIGIENYLSIIKDDVFWATIWRTIYFTVMSVGIELIFGVAVAQLIHSHPVGWKILRTCLIIPWAVPTVVNGAMWRWIYSADYGALNALLLKIGIIDHYVAWLTDPLTAMNLVILADIWHSFPFIALIIQAALASIPEDLDEAAAVDGANAIQRFFSIRLPLLRSAILIALVIRTVEAFRVFDIIYVITRGGPAFGTVAISFLTYFETFTYGHVGKGSALSFLISLFTLGMAMLYIRFLYKPEESRL